MTEVRQGLRRKASAALIGLALSGLAALPARAEWLVMANGVAGRENCFLIASIMNFRPPGTIVYRSPAGDGAEQQADARGWMCRRHEQALRTHNVHGACFRLFPGLCAH
jgi:hypothetical protein